MRTKKEILKDYLVLLNEEKKLGYSPEEIDNKLRLSEEITALNSLLDKDLATTKDIDGQLVFALRAFYVFCNVVVKYDFKTGDIIWNHFVEEQFKLVEWNKFSCYMAQRGGGKTFFHALYVVFKMYSLSDFDVCYSSNIPRQRKRFLRLCAKLIDKNELLHEKKDVDAIANKTIPWGNEELEYNGGTLEGTTVGTTPRGGHFNHVIVDDPLREDKKYTYEYIVNYIQGVLRQTIYRKKGRYVVSGTPEDPDDPFHILMNEKLDKNNRPLGKTVIDTVSYAGFYSKIFPAILNMNTKEVLVPSIWNYNELMKERERIGDIRFQREMMCNCTTYRNSLISSSLFRSVCDGSLRMLQKGEDGKKYVIFVDPATSDAPTADFTAMAVWEDDVMHNKFILRNLFHAKGHPITDPTGGTDDQTHVLFRLWKDFNNALIIIEKNNAGVGLIQSVTALAARNGQSLEVIEHFTHTVATGKATKKPGKADDVVDYIEFGLKAGVVVIPSNPDCNYTVDIVERVKTEHLNFGVKKGKSGEIYQALAGKDDIFTACYGAFKYRGDMVDTYPGAITLPG